MFAEFFRDPIRLVYTNQNIFSSVCLTLLLVISCFFREDLTIEKRKLCMRHAHFCEILQLNLFWSGLLKMALALKLGFFFLQKYGIRNRWQERKLPEGKNICPFIETAAVAQHLQLQGCTMPTGTLINYLLLDPTVDIFPAEPRSMWLLGRGRMPAPWGRFGGTKGFACRTESEIRLWNIHVGKQQEGQQSVPHEKAS